MVEEKEELAKSVRGEEADYLTTGCFAVLSLDAMQAMAPRTPWQMEIADAARGARPSRCGYSLGGPGKRAITT